MKKTLLLFLFLLSQFSAKAEDALQVVPFATTAGVTLDDGECFSLEMTNTHAYTAMEFHLYLPKGMTLDMDYPFDMNPDRFPGVTKRGVFYPNHDYDITNPSEGHYYIKIYNTKLEVIDGTEGELLSFYYATADDMAPGYHLIKVTGAILGVDSHTGIYPEASASWVKIGEPAPNALLDLGNYDIPSFVQAELPEQNVIIDGVCDNLVITDGAPIDIADEFTATHASYTRSMANEWGTICLPFAIESSEALQLYELQERSENTLLFREVESLEAGNPGVCRRLTTEAAVTVSADNAAVVTSPVDCEAVAGLKLVGTYEDIRVDVDAATPSYYIKDNTFMMGSEYFTVGAFRAYFESESAADANARILSIAIEDATGARSIIGTLDTQTMEIFTLDGVRVKDNCRRGILVRNGQKHFNL